jgi:hypothetical protein
MACDFDGWGRFAGQDRPDYGADVAPSAGVKVHHLRQQLCHFRLVVLGDRLGEWGRAVRGVNRWGFAVGHGLLFDRF